MAIKGEPQKLQESFQFYLSHDDIVNMMNDSDVQLDGGNVSQNQIFEVWIEKSTGSKIYLRDMQPSDKILIQYVRITDSDSTSQYSQVDVNP